MEEMINLSEEITNRYGNGQVIADNPVDIKLRNMIITGPVDEEMSCQVCRNLFMMNAEDPTSPICMYINTYGGTVHDMLAIYDVMQFIKAPIYTVGFGKIMSAGVLILAAGEKGYRFCLPHTSIMIHRVSGGAIGSVEDIESSMGHMAALQTDMEKLLSKHSKITAKQMKAFMSGPDSYLKPKEALKLGIIDRVTGVVPRIMY